VFPVRILFSKACWCTCDARLARCWKLVLQTVQARKAPSSLAKICLQQPATSSVPDSQQVAQAAHVVLDRRQHGPLGLVAIPVSVWLKVGIMTGAPRRAFQIVVAATRNWGIGMRGGLPFELPGAPTVQNSLKAHFNSTDCTGYVTGGCLSALLLPWPAAQQQQQRTCPHVLLDNVCSCCIVQVTWHTSKSSPAKPAAPSCAMQ
jgi:hypothetical protein